MNLLSNALKYTQDRGTISLRHRERPSIIPGRGQYEFIVKDNGIGMSEEFVRHIFEPFTRTEESRISKTQGTGLGMTITANIVRMMNGTIEVKSKLPSLPVLVVDEDQAVCESGWTLPAFPY